MQSSQEDRRLQSCSILSQQTLAQQLKYSIALEISKIRELLLVRHNGLQKIPHRTWLIHKHHSLELYKDILLAEVSKAEKKILLAYIGQHILQIDEVINRH
ncbi:hypothetical protein [Shewanella sp. Isolate11]|uniref:hypothetical protein n=1 Tax=Shewanella sp. Isolate11 TaxID=2908530 RepID=UPI001EFEB4D2|nr:hypothetical protein [Shewanella sp. Isolate11]MCG9696661.1 hypothetical protein [Shewanella sp. Isolate11]